INPNPEKIRLKHKDLLNYVKQNFPQFEVHNTDVSVNVILKDANKGEGLKWLCETLNLEPEEVAYIGDSSGDVPALNIAGKSFAPLNATPYVKEISDYVVDEATMGVLEAYEKIIQMNANGESRD